MLDANAAGPQSRARCAPAAGRATLAVRAALPGSAAGPVVRALILLRCVWYGESTGRECSTVFINLP